MSNVRRIMSILVLSIVCMSIPVVAVCYYEIFLEQDDYGTRVTKHMLLPYMHESTLLTYEQYMELTDGFIDADSLIIRAGSVSYVMDYPIRETLIFNGSNFVYEQQASGYTSIVLPGPISALSIERNNQIEFTYTESLSCGQCLGVGQSGVTGSDACCENLSVIFHDNGFTCAQCGDGICSAHEDYQSCPQDCSPPPCIMGKMCALCDQTCVSGSDVFTLFEQGTLSAAQAVAYWNEWRAWK